MAVLSWHYQSFAKVFCHFCAIFVLCSCTVTSFCVPPDLWSESCCHPTPKRAGLCHPLLVRVPATLHEVCQAHDLCQALAHPAQGTHCAMPGPCNATGCPLWPGCPCSPGTELLPGIISQPGNTNSTFGREANPSWEYFWIFIFTIVVGKPVRSAEPWQRGCCHSPTLGGNDTSACVTCAGCWKLLVAAINSSLSPDNY